MTVLSDKSIRARLAAGSLVITPEPADEQMQPASVDLRLGTGFEWPRMDSFGYFTPVRILPGDFMLGHTSEIVSIPDDLVGFLSGKSSWARKGLTVHVTAGLIDPGFHGQIVLELVNHSHVPIDLHAGVKIAQLSFQELSTPAERPYGSAGLGSHYQGQRGAVGSRA